MNNLNMNSNPGGMANTTTTTTTGQTETTQSVGAPAITQVPVTAQDGTSVSTQVTPDVVVIAGAPVIVPAPLPTSASDQAQVNAFFNTYGWGGNGSSTAMTTMTQNVPDPTYPQINLPPQEQAQITIAAQQQGKDPAVLQQQAKQVIETVRQQIINDPDLPPDAKQEVLTLLITNSDLNGGPPPSSPQAKAKLDAARQEITNNLASIGIDQNVQTDPFITPQSIQQQLNNQIPQALLQTAAQINEQPTYGDDYTDPKVVQAANSDPEIVALAKSKGEAPIAVYKEIQQARQQVLNQILNNPEIPESDKQAILSTLLGDGSVPLSPNAQKYLNDIRKQTNDALVKMGLKDGSNSAPLNGTGYKQDIQNKADDQFETALAKRGLTPNEQQQIKNAYYLPDNHKPLDPKLQGILSDLTNGNPPTTDSTYYEGVLNSAFQNAFLNAMKSAVPAISAADQQIILNTYPAVPARLQSIVNGLTITATQKVQGDFGLSPTWAPSVKTIIPAGSSVSSMQSLQTLLDTANSLVSAHMAAAESMPDGPEKTSYINFLKEISKCLQTAQDCIYAIQASASSCARQLTKLVNAIQQAQIDLEKISDAKIKHKQHKHKRHGILGHIMRAITCACVLVAAALVCVASGIVSVATLGLATPGTALLCGVVVTLAVGYVAQDVASQAAGKDQTYMQVGMEKLTKAIEKGLPGELGFITAMIVQLVITVAVGWQNPMLAFSMLNDSGFCATFGKACYPNDPQKAQWASLGMQMAVMVVGMCCMAKFGSNFKMVQGLDKLSSSANGILAATAIITGTLTVATGAIDIQNAQLDIEIAKLKKRMDMAQAQVDAMVTILKKLIQTLMDMVNAQGDDLVQLAGIQANLRTGASDVMTQLARAGAA